MATVINPDNGEFIVNGSISADGNLELGKVRIDNTDDINLTAIPPNYALSDVALNVAGGSYVAGNSYVGGTFIANGDVVTLGNASGSLTLGANVSSDVIPSTTETYNLGSVSSTWNKIYTKNVISPQFIDCITSASLDYQTDMIQTATNATISLADAENGFVKNFITISSPSSPVTVTPTNAVGFTSIRFTNIGDSAQLIYHSTGWHIISVFRTTVI